MAKLSPCKDCSESIDVTTEQIEEMLQRMIRTRNKKLVDEETSSGRLSLCKSCPAYGAGGTCTYCGCLVRIKTKWEGERCPYPSNPKW
jgi:hypothetical protein